MDVLPCKLLTALSRISSVLGIQYLSFLQEKIIFWKVFEV